jgi:hypothetical protein
VLQQSPIAKILASHEAKARIEPDRPMPEPEPGSEAVAAFLRQREREQAVTGSGEVSHTARVRKMQPAPEGFLSVASYPPAGIRVNKSFDRGTVAIQFDETRRPSNQGLMNEVETLQIEGFRFEPLRRQWERRDTAQPGMNTILAVRLAESLAAKRTGREL